jgi:hypothetical protein
MEDVMWSWKRERKDGEPQSGASKAAVWRGSSPVFYGLFCYTVGIWWCEALDLACWLSGLPQETILSRLAALALTAWLMVQGVGIPRFEKSGISLAFLVGCVWILLFFGIKSIRPDMSYDTQNYHLLSQIPGFVDNLHYHVIPGRFQMYGFRLGDRMFYPFRTVLGLRMGTLLNAAAMLVIYHQLTVLLTWFQRKIRGGEQESVSRLRLCDWPSVLAFLIASRFELLQESGSYMVELLALPFFLEMVFLLIREAKAEYVKREAVVFCLMGGIFFCLKMTNIVYLAPMVLFYIWKIRKFITPGLFTVCLAVGILPVSIYLVYNGLTMGNPVYPYYNTVFHSPYFADSDFKDMRWGPQNGMEILLWPYYMIRYPDYRLTEIPSLFNLDLAVFYLAAAAFLIAGVMWFMKSQRERKRTDCNPYGAELWLIALYGASFLAWAATTGHIRYFMGGLLLGGLVCGAMMLRCVQLIRASRGFRPAAVLVFGLFAVPFVLRAETGYRDVWNAREWALRDGNRETYRQNLPFVFRDQELFPEEVLQKIDRIFLTWIDCGSYARLAGEEIPVWNRYSVVGELGSFQEEYLEEIEAAMERGEGVYDMFPQGSDTLEQYLQWMNEAGWYVHDLFYLDTILRGSQSYTMAGLEMAHGRKNTWYYGRYGENSPGLSFEKKEGTEQAVLSAIVGDSDFWLFPYPFEMEVTASDAFGKKSTAVAMVGEKEYEKKEIPLDLTGLKGTITVTFQSRTDGKRAVVINPEWK